MLLLRLKASGLGGRRDTTSILQSLLSLGMSYESESWATLTVQILLVTSGSKPEVVLHNESSSIIKANTIPFCWQVERNKLCPLNLLCWGHKLHSLHCEANPHIITSFITLYQLIFSGFSFPTHRCLRICVSGEYHMVSLINEVTGRDKAKVRAFS